MAGSVAPVPGASLLEQIVQAKRLEIAALRARGAARPPATPRDPERRLRFEAAIRRPPGEPLRVIAECKKASPSHGLIRPDYDPAAIARTYRDCGARALSVLTDAGFFQGELADVGRATAASGLPALRKDFILSAEQIEEAYQAGADAALLIVRILTPELLSELLGECDRAGLAALVEVHNEAEADLALAAGARNIGVNHRDLDTLIMDLSLTGRIAPRLRAARPELTLVGESGVESPQGLAQVAPHVDAVLIGAGLLSAPDIAQKWKAIFSG